MDIKKIKYGCPIVINYISDNDEEITLKSEEKPRPEMEKAFDRLAWQIMQIDGKKCSKDINIAVNELNIKYKKGYIEAYSVKGYIAVNDMLYTPAIAIGGIPNGGDTPIDKMVQDILKEAEMFVSGQRAQMKLFPTNTASVESGERYREEDE